MSKKKFRHPPRETVPREDRYMGVAWTWASMSKDPNTQVGAIIVSYDNRPLGTGYNGPPKQIVDTEVDWSRPEKYPFVIHAERNAIDHCTDPPRGATLYVTGPPCSRCMLDVVKAGIGKVVYQEWRSDEGSSLADREDWGTTVRIAKMGNVQLDRFKGNLNWLRDWNDALYHKGVFG